MDSGISLNNWYAFEKHIQEATSITPFKGKDFTRAFLESSTILLEQCIGDFVGFIDKAKAAPVNRTFNRFFNNPQKLLKQFFPFNALAPAEDARRAFHAALKLEYWYLNSRQRRLMTIFKTGDIAAFKSLRGITIRELVGITDIFSRSLFFWALKYNRQSLLDEIYTSMVVPFFKNGASRSADETTILHWAIFCNQPINVIEGLLKGDKDLLNRCNGNNASALLLAAELGNELIVTYLCSLSQKLIDSPTQDGTTPLFFAAQHNHLKVVKFLCSLPHIQINKGRVDGATALLIAARMGHLEVVKFLCSQPSILKNQRWWDKSPLRISIDYSNFDVALHLAEHPDVVEDFLKKPYASDPTQKNDFDEKLFMNLKTSMKDEVKSLGFLLPFARFIQQNSFETSHKTYDNKLTYRKLLLCIHCIVAQSKRPEADINGILNKFKVHFPDMPEAPMSLEAQIVITPKAAKQNKHSREEIEKSELGYATPTMSSRSKIIEKFTPFNTTPKSPWRP